jgi:hypothetical protein
MSIRRCLAGLKQLVRDSRERADHDYQLLFQPALYDFNQASDRYRILNRGASKLHHHYIIALLKSALSLCAHMSFFSLWPQRKTHRQIASGGGFG